MTNHATHDEDDIYREQILDHNANPRNFGCPSGHTFSRRGINTNCGDEFEFFVTVDGDGRAVEVSFTGVGCAISKAAASMLTEKVRGRTMEEIRAISEEDIMTMLGIPCDCTRIRCALLGIKTLREGVEEFETTK